jgi:hypothetical protein
MKQQNTLLALALLAGAAVTSNAQAALFDRGNGLIYDNVTNITIVNNLNLFQTQAAGNVNLISQIIAANNGVIHDTPSYSDNGTYILTSADFTASTGQMDWWGAQAWIGYLNKINYDGFNNWNLPLGNVNQTGQMEELFYNELGAVWGDSIITTHNANYNLFINAQSSYYWLNEYATPPYPGAFYFYSGPGLPARVPWDPKTYQYLALAVRSGDVSAVPVPSAVWLFGSGLLGLLGLKKRKTA